MEEEDGPHPSFTQLLDRGIAAEGALASWCPTMDLLALATADGKLHVHRLNWQRLWWSSPDAPITALEWRPDGKQLAVGLEDGSVLLLNTEDGEVQQNAQLLSAALTAISWTAAAVGAGAGLAGAGAQLSQDRTRRVFAAPPPAIPPAGVGLGVGYATCGRRSSEAWPSEPARMAVLACASAAGDLVLCTSHLFPLASLHLPHHLGSPTVTVLRLTTAPSLQQLTVSWHDGSPHEGALRLSTISMQHIGSHAVQLHRLALAAAHVGALQEGCRQSFQAACKEWQGGMRECEESSTKLAGLMRDYGTSGDPASLLQGLLANGAVGGALQQYITAHLGEPGLKKLARAVDAAVCSVHNLLTDHLQPQLEQLAFRLGELRGLSLCLPWRRVTGLQPDQVGTAERVALRLVMQAEAVRRSLVQAGAQYRTFFSWLLIVLRRMQEDSADALAGYPGSHLDSVAEFLVGQYQKDAVGPMLGSSGSSATSGEQPAAIPPAAAAAAADAAASGSMLDLVMEVLGRQALVQAADSTDGGGGGIGCSVANGSAGASSLAQLLQGLDAACSAAFDRTPELISPTLALTGSVRLGPGPSAVAAGYLSSSGPAAAVVAVAWEGQHKVMLLRSSSDGNSGGGQAGWEAALVHLPADNGAAMDLAFYKEGQLALLLAGSGGSAPAQDSGSACQLALLPQEHMQFVQLPAELLADSNALQLCEMLLESSTGSSGTPLAGDCRQRPVPYPRVQQPLAVSASRGVGCVMAGTQRVLLYDLEEDEGEQVEEEEESSPGEEGAADDMDSEGGYQSPTSF